MTHAEKEKRNLEIVALRKQGQSMTQISKAFELTVSAVQSICKRYGVAGVMSARKGTVKVYRNQYTNGKYDREANAKRYIEKIEGYEYAGNYTGIDGHVDIRCKTCGHVQTKSMVSIRHKRQPVCPACFAKAKAEEKEEKLERQKAEQEKKKLDKYLRHTFTQITFRICPVCNSVFSGNTRYCSKRCRDNNKWRMKDGYRYTFPLDEVYKRDKGICYLCGCKCDWNDYEERNGVIIYGDLYPSRDHVVPKSLGGENAWENIRLTHRICNSRKRNSPLVKN